MNLQKKNVEKIGKKKEVLTFFVEKDEDKIITQVDKNYGFWNMEKSF